MRARPPEAFKAKLGESVLFPHRLGKPEELASMVIELITNSYMNAEIVRVDGGIRCHPSEVETTRNQTNAGEALESSN